MYCAEKTTDVCEAVGINTAKQFSYVMTPVTMGLFLVRFICES